MPPLQLALPAQSNRGREPIAGIAALINAYAENSGTGQKSQMQVWAASGLSPFATLPATGGVRGLLEVDGRLYVVAGRTLCVTDTGGSVTVVGGIPSDGWVGMARNQRGTGAQTAIVCDGLAWIAVGSTLARVTTPSLPPPIDVTCVDRSFIYACPDGRMYRSEIDDGFTVSGLDTARAESSPDALLRVVGRGNDLLAIGTRSTEFWTDVGGEAFGFNRANVVNVGTVGADAVTQATLLADSIQDAIAWVATDSEGRFAGIFLASGLSPSKISTAWVDRIVDRVADKSSIIASSWIERGHAMLAFRLPDTTIVYDTATQLWHERQSRVAGLPATWRVGFSAVLGGRVVAGDATAPRLYWIDPEVADEDGQEMVFTVRSPPHHDTPNRIEMTRLHIEVAPGVGLASGADQDVNPGMTLRVSDDNVTWRDCGTVAIGAQGEHGRRASWRRLGTYRQRTFELSCSARVARGILAAHWEGTSHAP